MKDFPIRTSQRLQTVTPRRRSLASLLRYTLAAIFFAASVGCLGLWGWSASHSQWEVAASYYAQQQSVHFEAIGGFAIAWTGHGRPRVGWKTEAIELSVPSQAVANAVSAHGLFGWPATPRERFLHFPLWYPALVFALAAVGVLRIGQRFTIRLALIATTVVAALLGMIVVGS